MAWYSIILDEAKSCQSSQKFRIQYMVYFYFIAAVLLIGLKIFFANFRYVIVGGGRLTKELEYTTSILGEGSGTTNEIIIQTLDPSSTNRNLLTVDSMLLHYKALKAATKVTVDMFDT